MSCIDGDETRLFSRGAGKVRSHCGRVGAVVVDADKGRGDICLLVEMGEAEAREAGRIV